LDRLNDKSNISANEAIKFKNEAVRMSLDTTIEQSDIHMGISYRAKNNVTDLKIAVDNIKIAPSVNFSLVT
jgi:predicted transport protein